MVDGNEEAFGDPQTLAHVLEFLARLEDSQLKTTVIEEIKKNVKDYINNKLTDFATEDGSGGFLPKTIEKSNELRTNIVKEDNHDNYKHVTQSFDDDNLNETDYAKHLIDTVFPLFGCLYYMYYECATQCSDIKGADWWAEKCNETSQKDKQHLNQWLTDEKGTSERMIQRGFKEGGLSTKTGSELFPSGSDALLHYREAAQLQSALFYMLFLPAKESWNDAQSGHAVLFLQALCKKVKDGQFQDKYSDNDKKFQSSCNSVAEYINKLLQLNTIVPVALSPTVQYNDLLQAEHFWQYIEWLKENLKMLIDSLQAMAMDVKNWDEARLKSSDTFGPFPWGFTFNNPNWDQKKGQLQQQLEQQLSQLNEELESFKEKVQSLSATRSKGQSESDTEKPSASSASINSAEKPSPATEESSASTVSTTSTTSADSTDSNESTNSTSSTVGSVIGGLGGLGATAGAAYAGSGFLGPVAEGIGRFFKGLLF